MQAPMHAVPRIWQSIDDRSKPGERYAAIAREEERRRAALDAAGVRSWADAWELAVERYAEREVACEVDGAKAVTYTELDRAADRIAAWALDHGEARYGVRQRNGVSFLATVLGLAKAGKLAVLVGNRVPHETSAVAAHRCGVCTVIGERLPGLAHADPQAILESSWTGRSPREARAHVELDDPFAVIFTSGTTGRSKPALFSHRRMIGAGIAWGIRTGMTADDRCYISLPLSHGNALAVAFSSVVHVGARAVLRDKFSVRAFVDDVRRHRCTATVYIGELWRYLATLPASADDAKLPLRVIFGNGLHRSLWQSTVARFGIEHVVEHYGATELPAGALTNWTDTPGFCGFVPPDHADAGDLLLVDEAGREVPHGTPGELLIVVRAPYRGYLDPELDQERLRSDVGEPGVVYWRSGDLLTRTADGLFTFVDRLGDSFRWRGENVSAVDVEDAIYATALVDEAVVFGVRLPLEEGKVGMASIVPKGRSAIVDLEPIRAHLERTLPPYAIPIFLRQVMEPHGTTETLKIQKRTLADAPFGLVGDAPHAILRGRRYAPLDAALLSSVLSGRAALRPGIGVLDV
jgi:fatty-acyl-CoA synthase